MSEPSSEKPFAIPFSGLPDVPALNALRQRPQWVAWANRWKTGRWVKMPICPRSGLPASSSDPKTWGTYEEAAARVRRSNLNGVGFALADDDELTGIDLDKVRDPVSGEFEPWVADILAHGETYAELSPSGRGIRMFALGKVDAAIKSDAAHVEIYGRGRYLTVTGEYLPDAAMTLGAAPKTIEALKARVASFRAHQHPDQQPADLPTPSASLRTLPDGASGSDFFTRVKDEALKRLGEWVPIAIPKAKFQPGTGAWSISSRDLGRNLQERLSFHPGGVQDFGTEQASSPISALIDHGIADDATSAAHWICDRLAIDYDALWAETHPEPDIDFSRLQPPKPRLATVDGQHVESGAALPVTSIMALAASDLDGAEPPPREWHVPDLIPARTVTILTGDGATGKSLLALQLAVATAINGQWIGQTVKFGRCLFLTAEDEIDELHRRLYAIGKAESFELSVLENLHVASLAGEDAVLAAPDRKTGLLRPTALFERLRLTIDGVRPSLIVLDTLADLFGGNEVDRAQARQFVGMLRGLAMQFDCAILLLAHPSLSGMSSGSGNSGSTAWNNSVRSRLYLRRIIREEGGGRIVEDDPDLRELTTMKANYGRSGARTEMRWVDGRFVNTSDPVAANIDLGGLGAGKAETVFLKLLRLYITQGRNVSCNPGVTYAPSVFAADGRAEGIRGAAFKKAMEVLLETGKIENVLHGPPSKQRRRLDFAFSDPEG